MKRVGNFVKVENRADWDAHYNAHWDRFDDCVYPYNIDLTTFPIFMKEVESFDAYGCNTYVLVSKEEWEIAKIDKIKELEERILYIRNA